MKTRLLLLLFLFSGPGLFAQDEPSKRAEKNLTPLSSSTTRAVVVGVSDYRDPTIPDLQYAHKDAEAFAAGISRSLETGGNIPPENIRLLFNEQATLGNLYKELEWMVGNSQEGDRAII